MPVDSKRIPVPENTVPYNLYVKSESFKKRLETLVNSSGFRTDGRKPDEHRKVFLQTEVVSQAKGSAYIEFGKTKVIVSVYDPREIPNKGDYQLNGELYCEFKYAPFSCNKRRMHQLDSEEKQKSLVMQRSLEAVVCRHEFPNFQVDIYALVLENDGSTLSAAITAAGVALAHAGVPMYDIVTAVELGYQGEYSILDPTSKEEQICSVAVESNCETGKQFNPQGKIVLSLMSTHEQISGFHLTGNLTFDLISNKISVINQAANDLATLVKKCLVKQVVKTVRENKIES